MLLHLKLSQHRLLVLIALPSPITGPLILFSSLSDFFSFLIRYYLAIIFFTLFVNFETFTCVSIVYISVDLVINYSLCITDTFSIVG